MFGLGRLNSGFRHRNQLRGSTFHWWLAARHFLRTATGLRSPCSCVGAPVRSTGRPLGGGRRKLEGSKEPARRLWALA